MTTLDLEIPADLDALAGARSRVRTWLEDQGIEAVIAGDLLAVASEFLLHAIVRAGGAGMVGLVGEHRADGVRLTVRATPAMADAPRRLGLPPDPLRSGAIGRRLVESCCDDLAITTDDDGSVVECWRQLRTA